jgi:mRNA-degrading endonuclease RelE of RelBE toxin-antitoxin system
MEVIFDKHFTKDAKKIKDPRTKQKLRTIIEQLEQVGSLKAIVNIKKLRGHSTR